MGYSLQVKGEAGGQRGEFLIGIGKGTQGKHGFRAGNVVRGQCLPVPDPRRGPLIFTGCPGEDMAQYMPRSEVPRGARVLSPAQQVLLHLRKKGFVDSGSYRRGFLVGVEIILDNVINLIHSPDTFENKLKSWMI